MNLLLDTHVWLWCLVDTNRIPTAIVDLITDLDNRPYVSAMSAWELAIKMQSGKLNVPKSLYELTEDPAFQFMSFGLEHAIRLRTLPKHHRDPFDRALVAQAAHDGLVLITSDKKLRLYEKEANIIFC